MALEKGETTLRLAAPPAQRLRNSKYAADDVVHLDALYRGLAERSTRSAAAHGSTKTARAWRKAPTKPANAGRTCRCAPRNSSTPRAQRRLLRLLRWRDAYARSSDRPRSWILDNELATTLARTPPIDRDGLKRQLDAIPKSPRSLVDAIWTALTTPLPDEADAPPPRSEERDKAALRKLQDTTAEVAKELGLPDGVLASRRWLETLLDGHDWPGALSGWRRQQLEARLKPLLAAGGN